MMTAERWARDPRCAVTADLLRLRVRKGVPHELAITLPSDRGDTLPKDVHKAQAPGGPRRRLDWPAIIRLHTKEGLRPQEIAARVGAEPVSIRKGLKKRGAWRPAKPLKHGLLLRKVWDNMRSRCEDQADPGYSYCGAKGARVCSGWSDFRAFHAWTLSSGYKPGLCITRRRGTRVYSSGNCRWATRREAILGANHQGGPVAPRWTVAAFGERKGPTAWSRDPRCAVSLTTLLKRLRSGWPVERAITAPPKAVGRSETPTYLIAAFGMEKGLTPGAATAAARSRIPPWRRGWRGAFRRKWRSRRLRTG